MNIFFSFWCWVFLIISSKLNWLSLLTAVIGLLIWSIRTVTLAVTLPGVGQTGASLTPKSILTLFCTKQRKLIHLSQAMRNESLLLLMPHGAFETLPLTQLISSSPVGQSISPSQRQDFCIHRLLQENSVTLLQWWAVSNDSHKTSYTKSITPKTFIVRFLFNLSSTFMGIHICV